MKECSRRKKSSKGSKSSGIGPYHQSKENEIPARRANPADSATAEGRLAALDFEAAETTAALGCGTTLIAEPDPSSCLRKGSRLVIRTLCHHGLVLTSLFIACFCIPDGREELSPISLSGTGFESTGPN